MTRSNYIATQEVAITAAVGTTDEIPYGAYAGGMVYIPNGSSITSLTWHASHELGGTYEPAYHSVDEHVTPITYVATVQTVAADHAVPIPAELVGAAAIKAVGDAAGTVQVSLKSS
jgi:hypothetical protein